MSVKPDQTSKILRRFMLVATLFFYGFAFAMPDRNAMLTGLGNIILSPAQVVRDYFVIGNLSGTFLNMALVATACLALMYIPGAVVKGSTVAAFFLTLGFTTWGINIMNIWPFFLGVFLCALVRKQKLSGSVDMAMFATGLCPIVSEMLVRFPGTEVHLPTWQSALLALGIGVAVGFLTPAMAAHSPNLHKGFNFYSAALPAGLMGFFLVALLYKTAGNTKPDTVSVLDQDPNHWMISYIFLGILFVGSILAGFCLNKFSFRGYLNLLTDAGHKRDYTALFGSGLSLINFGVYGLFIVGYYTFVSVINGAPFNGAYNGVTLGITLCMVCFACAGANPGNVWPIMAGYVLMSLIPGFAPANAQALMIGLCYASGLAPVSGVYGPLFGIVAGGAHYALVTSVPALHNGFCLYNGGFTSVLIAVLLVPQLEAFFKTKDERKDLRRAKRRAKQEAAQ